MDITYLIFVMPALLLTLLAQAYVKSTFAKYNKVGTSRGITGAAAATEVLRMNGVYGVRVGRISGHLTDNFNPKTGQISLSDSTYASTSVAAAGVAAHEAGHAVQYAAGYTPIQLRSALVPVANIGANLSWPVIVLGYVMGFEFLVTIGILLFSASTLFQLVTLPVEFNASRRAMTALEQGGLLYGEELAGAKKVLRAAALTYVAALAMSVANLLRLLVLFGRRRRD